jgi:ribosomal protein L16/L10AE
LVVFDTSLQNISVQKNRSFKNSKIIKLNYGEFGIIAINERKMEIIQFCILKKVLKKLKSKKMKDYKNNPSFNKIWVSLTPNSVYSKKSKNSRMGKGKGMFDR